MSCAQDCWENYNVVNICFDNRMRPQMSLSLVLNYCTTIQFVFISTILGTTFVCILISQDTSTDYKVTEYRSNKSNDLLLFPDGTVKNNGS